MATLGSTAEPTNNQEWFGINSVNHVGIALTLPSGGPWRIYRLGAWLAGKDASASVKLILWTASGSVARNSATFTAAGLAFALGNNVKYEQDITDYEVAGGTTVIVGFWRDPSDPVQHGYTNSGSHYHKTSTSGTVQSLSGFSTHAGQTGAYLYYEQANEAPNAPTSLSPTGNAVVNSGSAPTVSGTRSDPDSGDYITAYEIEAYEDDGTTKVYDSGKISVGGSPTTFSRAISLPGSHRYFKWKARTWDKEDVAGPFSALQRFYANAVPATPSNPTVSGTNTLTPTFGGNFSDPGDTLSQVQIEVGQNFSPYSTIWASGDIAKSGTSWTHQYAGPALAWSTNYRVRYRVKDSNGAYSAWSAWLGFALTQPQGPDAMSPTGVNPRLSSLTPTLTVGHSANFRNDEIQVRTLPDGGGTLLWDKTWEGSDYAATGTKDRTYAGTALAYGGVYYWRARVELDPSGTISEWSEWFPFRINADPSAPTGMTPQGGIALTDTTPELRMTFADPDTDQGDEASLVDVEVRDNSDDSLDWSQTGATPSSGTEHVVDVGTPLVAETTYKWRARFTDTMGRQGPWSSYRLFKVSVAPVASLVSPADASTVTESTPTLDWGYSSSGGKAQYSYRIRVYDKGPTGANFADEVLAYDSDTRIGAETAFDVPFGYLLNDRDYRWEVTVTDTDGLTHTLT